MPQALLLQYARPTGQPWIARMNRLRRVVWKGLVSVSALLFVATIFVWGRSYFVPASVPPPGPYIPTFEPSDALELLVPYEGRFERWEYTEWDHRWYRVGSGIPIWVVAGMLLILPAISLPRARRAANCRVRATAAAFFGGAVAVALLLLPMSKPASGAESQGGLSANPATQPAVFEQVSVYTAEGYASPVFSGDSATFIAKCDDYGAKVWDARTLRPVSKPLRHDGIYFYGLSADGKIAFTADMNGVRVWDVTASKVQFDVRATDTRLHAVSLSPDGTHFVTTAKDDPTAAVWRIGDPHPVLLLRHEIPPFSAVFDPRGRNVITYDGQLHIFAASSGREICAPIRSDRLLLPYGVSFNRDGRRFLLPQQHGYTMVETATGEILNEVSVDDIHDVDGVGFSANGKQVWLTGLNDQLDFGPARIFDAATGKLLRAIGLNVDRCWIGPESDGWALCHIFVIGHTEPLQLWDIKGGRRTQFLDAQFDVDASPDESLFLMGSNSGLSNGWRLKREAGEFGPGVRGEIIWTGNQRQRVRSKTVTV